MSDETVCCMLYGSGLHFSFCYFVCAGSINRCFMMCFDVGVSVEFLSALYFCHVLKLCLCIGLGSNSCDSCEIFLCW